MQITILLALANTPIAEFDLEILQHPLSEKFEHL